MSDKEIFILRTIAVLFAWVVLVVVIFGKDNE